MIFILDSGIIVSNDWFIKNHEVITKDKNEAFFNEKYILLNEIAEQINMHPNYLDLRGLKK